MNSPQAIHYVVLFRGESPRFDGSSNSRVWWTIASGIEQPRRKNFLNRG